MSSTPSGRPDGRTGSVSSLEGIPASCSVSPYRERLQHYGLDWAMEMGLLSPDMDRAHVREVFGVTDLAAHVVPDASWPDLTLHGCLLLWLFLHDDRCVDRPASRDLSLLTATHARLYDVLDGAAPDPDAPFARSLHDIRQRVEARAGCAWARRLSTTFVAYLQAGHWERRGRSRGQPPDLTTYLKLRAIAGAMPSVFALLHVTGDVPADARFVRHVEIRLLTELASNHVCWANDLLGLSRECDEESESNLALILQRERGWTLTRAIDRVVEMTNAELRAFRRAVAMLPSFGDEDAAVHRYSQALDQWMIGHIQWSERSPRYRRVDG